MQELAFGALFIIGFCVNGIAFFIFDQDWEKRKKKRRRSFRFLILIFISIAAWMTSTTEFSAQSAYTYNIPTTYNSVNGIIQQQMNVTIYQVPSMGDGFIPYVVFASAICMLDLVLTWVWLTSNVVNSLEDVVDEFED
jgi:hypothetical protein